MIVTAAFAPGRAVEDLTFLPDEAEPWKGLITASIAEGGYDIYDLDGELIAAAAGPQLRSITAAPSFPLRGASFPLLFGVDGEGEVRAQALLRDSGELIEIALGRQSLSGQAAGICRREIGIGYIDLIILGEGEEAEIWRVQDMGEEALDVSLQATIALPFPARACASTGDGIVVGGPGSGLVLIDRDGNVAAEARGHDVADLIYAELLGRRVAIAPVTDRGRMIVFDALTLEEITEIDFTDGLNAPAAERPGAVDMTDANFGGSPFAGGIMAVYDRADMRIKLVGREVITRAVVAPPEL